MQVRPSTSTDIVAPSGATWAAALRDVRDGVTYWRMWGTFALNDIRQRYRRTRFGQFWITLSAAIFIVTLGLVYGGLFKQDLTRYFPHLAANFILWTYLSTTINESCQAFTGAEGFLRQTRLPKTLFVVRVLARNLLALAHGLIVVVAVFAVFNRLPGLDALMAIPGFLITTLNLALIALITAILATRYRDLPQIVANLLLIVFFISPIMWHEAMLPADTRALLSWSPVSAHLAVVTGPLLGEHPTAWHWQVVVASTVLLSAAALALFTRARSRLVYWL